MATLRESLAYEPMELRFGTSGRRGELIYLTPLEVYINALAEIEYLQSLGPDEGGIHAGDEFYLARDLRPSSTGLAEVVARAARDAGMLPVNVGLIPTPALTYYATSLHKGSIMVTGSHIPFDRNGYKTNTAQGELMKRQEAPINSAVADLRARIYGEAREDSAFDSHGRFKRNPEPLPPENGKAGAAYVERYLSFFPGEPLAGMRLLVYQHSAVGRDLLANLLGRLGADVIAAGRSDSFVPIDTENIDDTLLAVIQRLTDEAGAVDAVVSTDGDSDRPLILGVDKETGRVRFFGGDLVGMVVAEYLGADAVTVPVTCNDAIDRGPLAAVLEPKTKIGSPYVIEGMGRALLKGRRAVCGWEPNGGFLTGTDLHRGEAVLRALPTRDAVLPIVSTLVAAREKGLTLAGLFDRLPARFSQAALLRNFPRAVAQKVMGLPNLTSFFAAEMGFAPVARIDRTDGERLIFANGEVAHIRPSGNADEFRFYAVADTQARADEMVRLGVAEPDGILRRMERAVRG